MNAFPKQLYISSHRPCLFDTSSSPVQTIAPACNSITKPPHKPEMVNRNWKWTGDLPNWVDPFPVDNHSNPKRNKQRIPQENLTLLIKNGRLLTKCLNYNCNFTFNLNCNDSTTHTLFYLSFQTENPSFLLGNPLPTLRHLTSPHFSIQKRFICERTSECLKHLH